MTVVYDAGQLIALDRGDRHAWAKHRLRLEIRDIPIATAPVVAQVSRSDRQALLRRALRDCDVVPFVDDDAHEVGALLARSKSSDVVDAHVIVLASKYDATVLTSDETDLRALAAHVDGAVRIKAVS